MILQPSKGRVTEGRLIKIEYFAATIPAQADWLPFFYLMIKPRTVVKLIDKKDETSYNKSRI